MPNLPTKDQMLDPEVSTGSQKAYLGDFLDFVSQVPWGNPVQQLTLTGTRLEPTKGINLIDAGDDDATRTINTISIDGVPDGQGLFLSVLQDNATITLKNDFGGIGTMYLFQNKDVVLTSQFFILLVRRGNYWYQMNTSGYIFNELGNVDYSLLPNASNSFYGLMRYATDSEFTAGTAELLSPNVKQVQDKIKQINTAVNTKVIFPVGFETFTALSAAPDGWMFEQGQVVSRNDFPELFEWATTNGLVVTESEWSNGMYGAYSSGDGVSTFRVPDLRERYIVGAKSGTNTLNKYIADTIKNITGYARLAQAKYDAGKDAYSGALSIDSNVIQKIDFRAGGGWPGTGSVDVSFNASRVVSTSDRVQPRSIVRNYMVKYRSL